MKNEKNNSYHYRFWPYFLNALLIIALPFYQRLDLRGEAHEDEYTTLLVQGVDEDGVSSESLQILMKYKLL